MAASLVGYKNKLFGAITQTGLRIKIFVG